MLLQGKGNTSTDQHLRSPPTTAVLPDVVGSSNYVPSPTIVDEHDITFHIRTSSQLSLTYSEEIDYHKSLPGTPTKLTEL